MSEADTQVERKAVHMIVSGRVQGVGFRHFTRTNATRQGVGGWVRNKADGTVEIWAEGRTKPLDAFIAAIRRGPSHSWVDDVKLNWKAPEGRYRSFEIRY